MQLIHVDTGARGDLEDKLPAPPEFEDRPLGNPKGLGSFEYELSRKLQEIGAQLLCLHAQEVQRAHESALAASFSVQPTDRSEPVVILAEPSYDATSNAITSTTRNSLALPYEAFDSPVSTSSVPRQGSTPFLRRSCSMNKLRRKSVLELPDTFVMQERWQSKLDWARRWEWQEQQSPFGRAGSWTSTAPRFLTTAASPGFDAAWGLVRVAALWIDLICIPLDVIFQFVFTMPYIVSLLLGRCFWSLNTLVDLRRALRCLSLDPGQGRDDWESLWGAWGSLLVNVALLALEWSMLILEIDGWELWISFGRTVRLSQLACEDAKDAVRTLDSWLHAALPTVAADMLPVPHRWFYTAVGAHWATCFWFRGVGTLTEWHSPTSGLNIVDSLLSALAALLITCVLTAQTTSHLLAMEKSSPRRLKEMISAFSQREGVTRRMMVRMAQSRQASARGAVAGRFREDEEMMKHFPSQLRRDLLGEIRQPVLTAMQLFDDMERSSRGIISGVANAAVGTLVLTGEAVFATREAARHMYFVDEGSLRYRIGSDASPTSARTASGACPAFGDGASSPAHGRRDGYALERKERISEPALWMDWHHVGECTASCDSVILALSGEQLFEAISGCQASLWLAVKYAARFVSVLSDRARLEVIDDLIKITLPLDDLVDETPSNVDDHFAFISHYKEEAGTEATLVQAELLQLLQADPSNPANDMLCPVFLDSEDLTNLQALKGHVKSSRNLILLLTPDVLRRPWCLLEIATAFTHGVPIVLVRVERPGLNFEYPGDDFYAALRQGGILTHEAAHMLSREGVELSDLEAILRQVFMHIAVPFSPHRTAAVRQVELADVLKRCHR